MKKGNPPSSGSPRTLLTGALRAWYKLAMISATLLTAVIVQVLCQLFKLIYYSFRDGKFEPKYLVTAGGIPSAHSAFVTSLTVAVAFRSGISSDVFAVAFVFMLIVLYDAYRLRGAVQNHARLLNRISERLFPEEKERLNEMLGHTMPEILLGILLGGIFSGIVSFLLLNSIQ